MNSAILHALDIAISELKQQGILDTNWESKSQLTRTKDRAHGDFASNVALIAAKAAKKPPRELAQQLVAALPEVDEIEKVEIAGPGFINFYLKQQQRFEVLNQIQQQQQQFGHTLANQDQHIHIEFVSANPTSSLHVGHGRGAAYGMSVANIFEATGAKVDREYYVNDAGRQMDILATSTYLRYLELTDESFTFPSNGYRGDYVRQFAQQIFDQHGNKFHHSAAKIFTDITPDAVYSEIEPSQNQKPTLVSGDKERHIDDIIQRSQQLLGSENYQLFHQTALNNILDDIKQDLAEFGVHFQHWFSEASLGEDIDKALLPLQQKGLLYEKEGNIWFKSTEFGDEKDRVVKRRNGQFTYFASDIAYHLNKLQRGYTHLIDVWGSDHHGYVPRVKAAISALGFDETKLAVLLVQFVTLWRGEQMIQMSSRSGQFVTLRELRNEVGNDAARFYYVMRKSEQHIDFDLELAISQSKDNAVYYIQYAHARICRMMDKAKQQNQTADFNIAFAAAERLNAAIEIDLLNKLAAYPEIVLRAANQHEPHQIGNYLKELAALFHAWYNEYKVLSDDQALTQARLLLSNAVRQVIANGLGLLGVSAPQQM